MKPRKASVARNTSTPRWSKAIIGNASRQEMAEFGVLLSSLQERIQQRVASDLHDSTCQHLIAASLSLMRVRGAVSEIAGVERICDDIDASIEQALRELRAVAYLLHPQDLLAEGLKTTIEQFANGFSARTLLKVSLEIAQEIDGLPYETKRSLLSVVQEALSNVFRHAKATRVEITMQATDTHFLLRISDDGRGMPTGRERISLGVGIPSMRARLRQMGGALEFYSSSGVECDGTTLCATIPRGFRDRQKRIAPTTRFHSEIVAVELRNQESVAREICERNANVAKSSAPQLR